MFKELYQDNLLGPKLTWLLLISGLNFCTTYANDSEVDEFVALPYDWLGISRFETNLIKENSFISEVKLIVPFYYSYYNHTPYINASRDNLISLKFDCCTIPSIMVLLSQSYH